MFGKFLRIGLFLLLSVNVFAGKIDKAYEALKIYDYFKAKSLFQETLDDEPVAARYGLTVIYYRNDNPFHNLDTAYAYIKLVEVNYQGLKDREKENLLEFSIDEEHISKLKEDIILASWEKIKDSKNVKAYNAFIEKFSDYEDIEKYKKIRTDLAYNQALESNTFQAYREFYMSYPDDPRAEEVKELYEERLYETKTADGKLQSYIDFVYIYPESPFANEASDKIFEMIKTKGGLKSYKWFVNKYPDSPHAKDAWRNVFTLSFTDFNDDEIRDFKKNNPDFPYGKMLSEFRGLRDLELYQFQQDGMWGFIDDKGEVRIEPQYEFENDFSNEYALVANEEFVGYVNKKGDLAIDFIFDDGTDFIQGVASVMRGDSVALINKVGDKVLDFKFSEISVPKYGIVLAKRFVDGKYVYYDIYGEKLFRGQAFSYAEPFQDSLAIVSDGENYGVIDLEGKKVLPLENKLVLRDKKGRFRVQNTDSKFGVISISTQDTIIPFEYENIGKCSEGRYCVFQKDNYTYLKEDGSKLTKKTFKRFKGDVEETEFKNGFALKKYRNKYGVLDTLANNVFPNIFDEIGEITGFPVPCKKYGKWGYVTKKVTMWLPYKYTYAGAFHDGHAIAAKNGKYGVINNRKKFVIPFKYTDLKELGGEYYLAASNGKYGVINRNGKVILPFYYLKIREVKDGLLQLDDKDNTHYYDLKKKIFIYGGFPKQK